MYGTMMGMKGTAFVINVILLLGLSRLLVFIAAPMNTDGFFSYNVTFYLIELLY